jgi:hypothetical protein
MVVSIFSTKKLRFHKAEQGSQLSAKFMWRSEGSHDDHADFRHEIGAYFEINSLMRSMKRARNIA